jgi:hypothetical protein
MSCSDGGRRTETALLILNLGASGSECSTPRLNPHLSLVPNVQEAWWDPEAGQDVCVKNRKSLASTRVRTSNCPASRELQCTVQYDIPFPKDKVAVMMVMMMIIIIIITITIDLLLYINLKYDINIL